MGLSCELGSTSYCGSGGVFWLREPVRSLGKTMAVTVRVTLGVVALRSVNLPPGPKEAQTYSVTHQAEPPTLTAFYGLLVAG